MHVTAIVPAAGSGSRMGGDTPKQYLQVGGIPLLGRTLRALREAGGLDALVLVVPPGQAARCRAEVLEPFDLHVDAVVAGGEDRQASVHAGLSAAPAATDLILVHDGARPFVTAEIVREALAAASEVGAAVAGVPLTDTVKRVDADLRILETPRREGLWAIQTPQAFRAGMLREAHARALADGFRSTDDSALLERIGCPVRVVRGSRENLKITTPADILLAEMLLARGEEEEGEVMTDVSGVPVRVGIGFDMHRLAAGRPLILGGVTLPFERGLEGDSDADVLTHAVLDALLGAAGAGDIGSRFGVGRPELMGISSLLLLERALAAVAEAGYRPGNVDATVVAERPRLSPHVPAMRENLARVLGIPQA
ncbi:MAG: 2-C-methyl-D-erythritol 4-phosphate cytidylyltransferase, partial [Candidatus Methylomirabilota bacterium]